MRHISTIRGFWLACAVATIVAAGEASAQGLGDAAKKEKARRGQPAQQAAPVKSYTQDDLKGQGAASSAAAAAPASETAQPTVSGLVGEGSTRGSLDADADKRHEDEQRWRYNAARAQSRVESARRKHQFLSSLNLVPGYEYVDGGGRTVIGSVEQLQGMTAAAKSELDAAERALEDLQEQARRAGVPPGWLR